MCSLNKCSGTKRVQCMKCKGYFDLCPKSYHRDSTCPHCGVYFVGFTNGQQIGLIKEVPWWYGKKIPSWVEVEWGENHGIGESYAIIPEFYIDVNMHSAVEKGNPITRKEAIMYFENYAMEYWRRKIWFVDNETWDRMRLKSLHIL